MKWIAINAAIMYRITALCQHLLLKANGVVWLFFHVFLHFMLKSGLFVKIINVREIV